MSLRFLTAGESHGPAMTTILEGLPAGLPLSVEVINRELMRRQQGYGSGPRMEIESDQAIILSGVLDGKSTGAPITLMIENKDHAAWKGKSIPPMTVPRPGHADLVGAIKYGYSDLRPSLERASARETTARLAVGAICKLLLAQFGVEVGGYVAAIGKVAANLEGMPLAARAEKAESSAVRCPDPAAAKEMEARIEQAIQEGNTLGGIIEVFGLGLPPGLGSYAQWDRRLDARLGAAVLSVQAIKGVEIGPAFEISQLSGTEAQDEIFVQGPNLVRKTNRAGGIEAGITNGQPVLIKAAMKPIASTLTPQKTVDLVTGEPAQTSYERSDICPVPRAVPILEAMVAFTLAEALLEKLGGDYIDEIKPRFANLRRSSLSDLPMDDEDHVWWPK